MAERNDPTRFGFTPPASGKVRLSCNEVEALCLKAARGAGYDWGLAEEAGFAARWLHARGLDGLSALLAHLDREAGEAAGLTLAEGEFRATGEGHLCPVALGAALSDFAALGQRRFRAKQVDRPLLLLPFLHQIARGLAQPMTLEWDGQAVAVSPDAAISGDLAALARTDRAAIAIAPSSRAAPPIVATQAMPAPSSATLAGLNAFAMWTAVPATAASRADAGSAAGDND